jgi:hypothetical protein
MRLSDWRARAPAKDAVSTRVDAVVTTGLTTLGADADPDCWIAWGDDPSVRYLILAPIAAGLIQLNVRVNVAGEGPRASGKVIRWHRVQLGELGIELQGGHRLATFQIDTQVLTGADEVADRIAAFAQVLYAAVDGRPIPSPARATNTKPTSTARPRSTTRTPGSGTSTPALLGPGARPTKAPKPPNASRAPGTSKTPRGPKLPGGSKAPRAAG